VSAADPRAVLERFAACLERGDPDGAASCFAPGATYSEPPRFAFAGREAIREFLADFAARHREISFTVVRTLAAPGGDLLAAEWRFAHTRLGEDAGAVYEGMSWIELDGGLIARWRGFSARVDPSPGPTAARGGEREAGP
jgi:SnoaL-like domain